MSGSQIKLKRTDGAPTAMAMKNRGAVWKIQRGANKLTMSWNNGKYHVIYSGEGESTKGAFTLCEHAREWFNSLKRVYFK